MDGAGLLQYSRTSAVGVTIRGSLVVNPDVQIVLVLYRRHMWGSIVCSFRSLTVAALCLLSDRHVDSRTAAAILRERRLAWINSGNRGDNEIHNETGDGSSVRGDMTNHIEA